MKRIEKPVFLRYSEYNGWEGERWNFVIRMFDVDDIALAEKFVGIFDEKTRGVDYSLYVVTPGDREYDELLSKELGASGKEGYMAEMTVVEMKDEIRRRVKGVMEAIENDWGSSGGKERLHRDDYFYKMKAFA